MTSGWIMSTRTKMKKPMSDRRVPFEKIVEALGPAKRVLTVSHARPDGDALGSTIAFALWLESLGKEVHAWNQDGVPEKFQYLPKWQIVGQPPQGEKVKFDAAIALDTAVFDRVGKSVVEAADAAMWVNIDHHVSNNAYGDYAHIEGESPATGQIVFDFLKAAGAEITPEIAGNLFAAISTDTGSFQYPSTTARTFEVGAELVRAGVDVGELSKAIYDSYPKRRLDLLRELLNTATFMCDEKVAACSLSLDTAERLGVVPEDNEGLIDHLRAVDGVVAAVFFEELAEYPGEIRVSMRSKNPAVDACAVCQQFGGGGHALAAGARLKGSLNEVERKVLDALCSEVRNAA